MHAIQKQHIVDLFVWVDDSLPKQIQTGRRSVLRDSELITILIWDRLTEPHKNLSAVYSWVEREYRDYFPKVPELCSSRPPTPATAGLVAPNLAGE